MYERNIPGNIKRIKIQSSCKHMKPSCSATRTGNQIKSSCLFFLTTNVLITFSTLIFLVLWMSNNDKFNNLSSPIVVLRQFFTRRMALNERSLDAEDTDIVINTVKIAYILGYKSWFVTLSVSSHVCGFSHQPYSSVFSTQQLHQEMFVYRQYPYEKNQRLNQLSDLLVCGAYLFKHFIQSSNFKHRFRARHVYTASQQPDNSSFDGQ